MLTGITGFTPPVTAASGGSPTYVIGTFDRILIPVSTTLGGLISGIIIFRFAPEAEGHGTDAAIDAFHNKNGKIRRRVPLVKTVASAITIGSGGSAGREGPTAQIAAGFGSFIADTFRMDDHDRRIAMAAGIGAGIGSIFLAPLGGALLSTEILYRRDFEVDALIPSIIASVTGYIIFGYNFGYRPLFDIPGSGVLGFAHPESLILYSLVGVVAGLFGVFYVISFYGIQGMFRRIRRLPKFVKPAIGGLIVGLIGIFFPEILGLGYGWVQLIFYDRLSLFPVWLLLALIIAKIVATSFTIGSGGSGGVFAPGMVTGALVGALMGVLFVPFFPYLNVIEVTIIGMISFFGGISKAPISVIIMGTEMTGGYTLFLPLMIATVISYYISGQKYSIYSKQLPNRQSSPAHRLEYERPILDDITAYESMKKDYYWVSPDAPLREALQTIRQSKTKGVVVQENGVLKGFLSVEAVKPSMDIDSTRVRDIMDTDVKYVKTTATMHTALDLLTTTTTGKVVVVDDANPQIVRGTIGLADIAEAYNREIRKIKLEQSKIG
ncbi:MAG: chloride channel protein [Candidatus Thermoplasmatota archaeon]|jgi:CIC family chloride channel protein|nr:chloride channel protein [Candidatus Thermoplasmatota archaeon]